MKRLAAVTAAVALCASGSVTSTAHAADPTTTITVADPAGDVSVIASNPDNQSVDISNVSYTYVSDYVFPGESAGEPGVKVVLDFANGFEGSKGDLQKATTEFKINGYWHMLTVNKSGLRLTKAKTAERRNGYELVPTPTADRWYTVSGQIGAVLPVSLLQSTTIEELTTTLVLVNENFQQQAMDLVPPTGEVLSTPASGASGTQYEWKQTYWTTWAKTGSVKCQATKPAGTSTSKAQTAWSSPGACTKYVNGQKRTFKKWVQKKRTYVSRLMWLNEGQSCQRPSNAGASYSCVKTGNTVHTA